MSIAVLFRALVALAACGTLMAGAAASAQERRFSLKDYETYFAPGRFATWSPFYQSNGAMEVIANRKASVGGRELLEQTIRSFDVAANYDGLSEYAFYKIESQITDLMMWDAQRQAWVYDYTAKEFDTDTARVWESRDSNVGISSTDVDRGSLHQFYRDADKRAGRDAKLFDRDFRNEVIGMWRWSCSWISRDGFDVQCTSIHPASFREETYYYRKLDLIG